MTAATDTATSLERVDGVPQCPVMASDIGMVVGDGNARIEVIRSISFSLQRGEIVSIVGPSGCGKTTLLNVICGLLHPTRGGILWHGAPINGVPPRVGYMLQKDLLFPWRTAVGNVMLGLQVKRMAITERQERAHALLEQLGLTQFANFYPSSLSGGMRQRVALARTLAPNPEVLLFDEPFSALDFQSKILLERDTVNLVRSENRSLLLITHDVEEAVSMSDRILVLSRRPCTIVGEYRIELPADRADVLSAREVPEFSKYVRLIRAQLDIH